MLYYCSKVVDFLRMQLLPISIDIKVRKNTKSKHWYQALISRDGIDEVTKLFVGKSDLDVTYGHLRETLGS